MEKELAQELMASLKGHLEGHFFDESTLLPILRSTDFQKPYALYQDFPENRFTRVDGEKRYHYSCASRIFQNEKAKCYQYLDLDKLYAWLFHKIESYSAETLTDRIRSDDEIVELMSKSSHPFSLLAEVQTYDHDNPDNELFVITQPVLVIPGSETSHVVSLWETVHTKYEIECGLRRRKVQPWRYLKHGIENKLRGTAISATTG